MVFKLELSPQNFQYDLLNPLYSVRTMILYSVSKWRENNASATRRIDDDGKVLKKIPLSLVQVGAYILRTVDRVSYWPSDSKIITKYLFEARYVRLWLRLW